MKLSLNWPKVYKSLHTIPPKKQEKMHKSRPLPLEAKVTVKHFGIFQPSMKRCFWKSIFLIDFLIQSKWQNQIFPKKDFLKIFPLVPQRDPYLKKKLEKGNFLKRSFLFFGKILFCWYDWFGKSTRQMNVQKNRFIEGWNILKLCRRPFRTLWFDFFFHRSEFQLFFLLFSARKWTNSYHIMVIRLIRFTVW